MFKDISEEIQEEFTDLITIPQENSMGVVGINCLADPLVEQYGPHLNDEFDLQVWQSIACESFPEPDVQYLYGHCLRVRRIDSKSRSYYRTQYFESWGKDDLRDMSMSPVKETISRPLPPSEGPNIPALDDDVKTRIQITLQQKSKYVRGSTGNFVVKKVKAAVLYRLLNVLLETYPKVKGSNQVVRVQLTEYRDDGGNYRKKCGDNLNLHNAEIAPVIAFIHTIILKNDWDHTSTVDEHKTKTTEVLTSRQVADVPAAIEYYDKKQHAGKWCLCKIQDGKSLVLDAASTVESIAIKHFTQSTFTYIINPKGKVIKVENRSQV